jgi:hypothetical protein
MGRPKVRGAEKAENINYEEDIGRMKKWDFRKENIPGPGPGKTEPTIRLRVLVFPPARTAGSVNPLTGRAPAAGSIKERHT